jgi:hypothetical protein
MESEDDDFTGIVAKVMRRLGQAVMGEMKRMEPLSGWSKESAVSTGTKSHLRGSLQHGVEAGVLPSGNDPSNTCRGKGACGSPLLMRGLQRGTLAGIRRPIEKPEPTDLRPTGSVGENPPRNNQVVLGVRATLCLAPGAGTKTGGGGRSPAVRSTKRTGRPSESSSKKMASRRPHGGLVGSRKGVPEDG